MADRAIVMARASRAAPVEIQGSLDYSGPGGEQADTEARKGRQISPELLLQYKWTIVLVAMAALIASQAAVWTLVTPKYKATARIEIAPVIPKLIGEVDDFSPVPFYGQYLATQVDVVTSNDVLNKVLDDPIVRKTRWYRTPQLNYLDRLQTPAPPLDRLKKDLTVDVPRGKQLLEVSMDCAFQGEAKVIVDMVVARYVDHVSSVKFVEDHGRITALNKKKDRHEQAIKDLETDLHFLQQRTELRTPDPTTLVERRNRDLEALRGKIADMELELLIVNDLLKKHSAPNDGEQETATYVEGQFGTDPRWRAIQDNIIKEQTHLDDLRLTMGEGHLSVKRSMATLDRLKKMKLDREAELSGALPAAPQPNAAMAIQPVVGLGGPVVWMAQKTELETRLAQTRKDIESRAASYDEAFDALAKYNKVHAELARNQQELQAALDSLRDIDQQRMMPANTRVLGPASEPQSPEEDKRPKMAIASLFGSLAAGAAVAFLRFQLNPKVMNVRDVTVHSAGGRILGQLPLYHPGKRFENDLAAMQQESVRTIRTALMPRFLNSAAGGQVLQITSAGPGTGKTTFALMLAESLAACGKRVLLVDADFRRCSLSRRLGCAEAPGLCDLLRNAGVKNEQVAVRRPPGVVVVPAGSSQDRQSSELLANGVLARRINEWRQSYDAVLIDSCPIVPIADGSMLAQQVDGSIVLVREGHCDRRAVADALAQINAVGGQALGLVFVGDYPRQHYAYYGYSATDAATH